MSAQSLVTGDRAPPFGVPARPPEIDGRPDLREWVAQNLHLATHEAESAWRCAEIADDRGLKYHVARLVAHVRQVVETTNEIGREVPRSSRGSGGAP
jgi:hypothetical protein